MLHLVAILFLFVLVNNIPGKIMTSPLPTVLFLSTCLLFPVEVRGDYPCLCNYQIEVPMLSRPDNQSQPLGSMYEFDCFAQVQTQMPVPDDSWVTLAYQHQVRINVWDFHKLMLVFKSC